MFGLIARVGNTGGGRTLLFAGLLAAIAVVGSEREVAQAGSNTVELDTYRSDNSTPISAVGPVLQDGQLYTITVQGSFSFWFADDWEANGPCPGADPPDMPVFPSPGTENGPVSHDAAWYFGGPDGLSDCDGPFPDESDPLGISLDGGDTWGDLEVDDAGTSPNASHTYHLMVLGQGEEVVFGLDDEKTIDNYGIFKFTIEGTATDLIWGDNDCSGAHTGYDALLDLLFSLILPPPQQAQGELGCPLVGDLIQAQGFGSIGWGDIDCSNVIGDSDAMLVLEAAAGLPVDTFENCPEVGETMLVER